MVELGGRLVIPRAPGLAAIYRNNRALVAAEQNHVRVVRVDPEVLIIVPTRRTSPPVPRFATINRFPADDAGRINNGRILRIKSNDGQISAPNTGGRTQIFGCDRP